MRHRTRWETAAVTSVGDRGATTNAGANLARSGRYTYPTNTAAYFDNAADFVEVRLKLTGTDTAFRLTYNSMSNPELVGATIALGGTAGTLRTIPSAPMRWSPRICSSPCTARPPWSPMQPRAR